MIVSSGVRPYIYAGDNPLRVPISGEPIGFSGVLFSEAAFACLSDHRLFSTSGAIGTPFRLYVNKDANVSILIEPHPSGYGYESGCINYITYITDLRNEQHAVCDAHGRDSCHVANAFRQAHLSRQHAPYPTRGNRREYYRTEFASLNATPSGEQLGASGLTDVDLAECQWQPFVRPSNSGFAAVGAFFKWPIRPFFPAVIKPNGTLPDANSIDLATFAQLALGTYASGQYLTITGDLLKAGTRIVVLAASGGAPVEIGNIVQAYSGIEFPNRAGKEFIGRRALYDVPNIPNTGVYLAAMDTFPNSTSGVVSHFPHNWENLNGIKVSNGSGQHDGLYVEDRLMFNIQIAGQVSVGRSLHNGRRVWGHTVGTEANSRGDTFSAISFKDGTGGISSSTSIFGNQVIILVDPPGPDNTISVIRRNHIWASADKTMSPVLFTSSVSDVLGVQGSHFEAMTYGRVTGDRGGTGVLAVTSILGTGRGLILTQVGANQISILKTLDYRIYHFFIDGGGNITPLGSDSATLYVVDTSVHVDTIIIDNMILTGVRQICNVNGLCQYQFGSNAGSSMRGRLFRSPILNNAFTPAPPLTREIAWGGSWRSGSFFLDRIVYPGQLTIAAEVVWPGADGITILGSAGLPFVLTDVFEFGTPAWDEQNNTNYLYLQLLDTAPCPLKFWFCKMNTSFQIFEANPVDSEDYLGQGRNYIIDI